MIAFLQAHWWEILLTIGVISNAISINRVDDKARYIGRLVRRCL